MSDIKWPRGYAQTFFAKIRKHRDKVLHGRVLYVDPATGATSNPGWALSDNGVLVASGEIAGLKGETPERLTQLYAVLHERAALEWGRLDMLVVEQLRGSMVAAQLHWSVGVILAALPAEIVCELPIPVWKSVARADPHYRKGDEADARAFCTAVLAVAASVDGADRAPAPSGRQRRKRGSTRRSRRVRDTKSGRGRSPKRGGRSRCRTGVHGGVERS
jgi:hypothetical protein